MTAPVAIAPQPVIEYARPGGGMDPRHIDAARRMLWLAILSGLCVGTCFLTMAFPVWGGVVHMALFATTIVTAVRAGALLAQLGRCEYGQRAMDTVAGVGLIAVGLGRPWVTPCRAFATARSSERWCWGWPTWRWR